MQMQVFLSWVLAISLVVGGHSVLGQESAVNYVVFPIKTELERHLLGSADAFAEINGDAMLVDQKVELETLDVDRFRNALATVHNDGEEAKIALFVRFAHFHADDDTRTELETELKNICKEVGFAKVRVTWRFEGGVWKDKLARLERSRGQAFDEAKSNVSMINLELVRLFAVRTSLEHFILGTVDCYVELRQPIDGRFKDFQPSIRQQIAESVARLELGSKDTVMFHFLATSMGQKAAEKYFSYAGESPSSLFAKQLGFQRCLYSMVPMGVGPEDLLNNRAPDFTLQLLAGSEFKLHTAIRDRVAVISFWGVACGGCRIEAPYLTKLHETYADEGLVVVAVNGYDESREIVTSYVEKAGLTHAIALMGSKVAKDKYTVMSYPVTFLVDDKGLLRDYHLGFEPGDEDLLFDKVSKLLQERAAR